MIASRDRWWAGLIECKGADANGSDLARRVGFSRFGDSDTSDGQNAFLDAFDKPVGS